MLTDLCSNGRLIFRLVLGNRFFLTRTWPPICTNGQSGKLCPAICPRCGCCRISSVEIHIALSVLSHDSRQHAWKQRRSLLHQMFCSSPQPRPEPAFHSPTKRLTVGLTPINQLLAFLSLPGNVCAQLLGWTFMGPSKFICCLRASTMLSSEHQAIPVHKQPDLKTLGSR